MEQNKYYHFETKSNFNSKKLSANSDNNMYTVGADTDIVVAGTPDVTYESICYIKETSQIWTHGKLYYKDVEERLAALENKSEGYKTYSSYKELGFTSAPKTSEFFAAMDDNTSAVISYCQVSDPPISNFKGVIVIYKVCNNATNYSDGRIFAYYDKGKDRFNEYDGNFPYIGDYYMKVYNGVAVGTWLCCNDFTSASSRADAFAHSAIRTQIDCHATSFIPLIGFASSKSMGNAYGDYNVSIGTQPSGDTTDTDTRLYINWDNGTSASFVEFRKDSTTTFRTRGFPANRVLVSDSNGVESTSSINPSDLLTKNYTPGKGIIIIGKMSYVKFLKMVLIVINGATKAQVTAATLPYTSDTINTNYWESSGIATKNYVITPVELYIAASGNKLSVSGGDSDANIYGQIIYFTTS